MRDPNESCWRHVDADLIVRASLCPPAVRTVVLRGIYWRDEDGDVVLYHETAPVLAIRLVQKRTYRRRYHGKKDDAYKFSSLPSPHHRDLVRDGWYLYGDEVEMEPVIVWQNGPEDGDLQTPKEFASCNEVSRVVVCSWPPEEDDRRLVQHWAWIDAEMREAIERKERSKQ